MGNINPIYAVIIIFVIVVIAAMAWKPAFTLSERTCGTMNSLGVPPLTAAEVTGASANCKTASALWDTSIYGGIPPDGRGPYSVRPGPSMGGNCKLCGCDGGTRIEYPNGTDLQMRLDGKVGDIGSWHVTQSPGSHSPGSWHVTQSPGSWRYNQTPRGSPGYVGADGAGQNAIATEIVWNPERMSSGVHAAAVRPETICGACREKYTSLLDGNYTDNLSRLNADAPYWESAASALNKANHIGKELFGIWEWDNVDSKWATDVDPLPGPAVVDGTPVRPWTQNTIPPCIKCNKWTNRGKHRVIGNRVDMRPQPDVPVNATAVTPVSAALPPAVPELDSADMLCYSHISPSGQNVVSTCAAEMKLL